MKITENNLGVAFNGLNDIKGLIRGIESAKKFGIKNIFYMDCRFKGFESPDKNSTDGTLQMLKDIHPDVVVWQENDLTIPEAYTIRNFRASKIMDVMIVMDTDEFIVGDMNYFIVSLNKAIEKFPDEHIFSIPFENHDGVDEDDDSPRIFIYPHNITTQFTHYLHFYKGTQINHKHVIKGPLTLHSDATYRTDKRQIAKYRFQQRDSKRERKALEKVYEEKGITRSNLFD